MKPRPPLQRRPIPDRPMRAVPRPRQRGAVGALLFIVVPVGFLFAALAFMPTLTADSFFSDAIVSFAEDRDTMLRQPAVRALLRAKLGADANAPLDPLGKERGFVVQSGDTARSVATALEKAGLVRQALAFTLAIYDAGKADAIQAGNYTLSPAMTPREMARILERAPGEQVLLKLLEGWRRTEIAAAVNRAFPHITVEAFLQASLVGTRKDSFLEGLAPTAPLEGFLFPDSYFFRPNATAVDIVDTLLTTFATRTRTALAKASDRGVKAYDVVRLASIVEREARDRSESATIAGVYANRLRIGMKLDADPTIQYAKGGWGELSLADLQLDSPYNTYRVAGLPPTPIASPGQAAIDGAASPATHEFLFFVARSDGSGGHAFARTLEEQEANRVKFGNR